MNTIGKIMQSIKEMLKPREGWSYACVHNDEGVCWAKAYGFSKLIYIMIIDDEMITVWIWGQRLETQERYHIADPQAISDTISSVTYFQEQIEKHAKAVPWELD